MKQLILILLFSLAVPATLFGQGDNYYYKYQQQKLLRKDNNRVSVKFTDARSIEAVQNALASTDGFDLAKTKEVGVGVFALTLNGASSREATEQLLTRNDVVSVQPIYITNDEGAELYLTDAICVQFRNSVSQQEVDRIIQTNNLTVRRKLDVAPYYLFSVPRGTDVLEVANHIALENSILFSHPDFYTDALIKLYVPNDRWFDRQFNLYNHGQRTRWGFGTPGADIKMIQAWDITRGSSSILVSVLDDGLDLTHEDFSPAKIVPGYDFANGDPSVQPVGANAHGTNTSGAIAADHNTIGNAGISPNSRLQMMKIFTDAGSGTTADNLARAIDSARISGADVMSNSWGYSSSDTNLVPAVREAIIRAKTLGRGGKGCVITFAAGNTASRPGNVGIITFPGSMSEVITVGASDRNDQVSFYSPNSNPAGNLYIEVTAPSHRAYDTQVSTEGFEFWSTDISGSAGYNAGTTDTLAGDVAGNYDGSMGGTSAACPQVAGAAALILAVNPNLTSNQVTNLLISSADTVGGYNYHAIPSRPGASLELGYGRMNVYRALVQSGANFGWVKGTITNLTGGGALSGVVVDFTDPIPQASGTSSGAGLYYAAAQVDTPGNTRNVTLRARKFGFIDTTLAITITRNDTVTRNFQMRPAPGGTLSVFSHTSGGNLRSYVEVKFGGTTVVSDSTNATTGLMTAPLPTGTYSVSVDAPAPYATKLFPAVVINGGATTNVDALTAAVLTFNPTAMRDTLSVGQVHAKTLALANTTPDTVRFRITDDNALRGTRIRVIVPEPVIPTPAMERPKGAPDIEHGNSPDGHGGPDGFGYSWIDSDEPGGPPVQFSDISSSGTQITTMTSGTLDDGYATITLPFSFPLYGNTYSSINIGTNGFVNFGAGSTSLTNTALPTAAVPNNGIYAFWDDLDFRFRGKLLYFNDAANGQFIIQYHQVPRYNSGGATGELDTLTFQLIMRPNGEVFVNYGMMYTAIAADLNSESIGLENAAGTVGLQTVFNTAYMHNNLTVRFYLPDASWLSETPTLGAIPPGGNQNIQVTFDASGLLPGTTYNANLFVEATHPDVSSPFIVPASLKVNTASGPLIILARTSVSFPSTEIGTNRKDSVTVRNGGSATLNLTSVTTTNPRFTAVAVSSSLLPGDSTRIRITYSPLAPAGSDTGRVIVLSNDPALPRVDVTLSGTSLRVAHIVASPDSFVFVRQTGTDTTTANLKIKNPGTDTLRYNINETTLAFDRIAGHQEAMKQPVVNEPLDLPKEAIDTRQGFASIDGAGGPDAFGYRWIDSDEPGGPAFNWIDISSTGTALDSGSAWIKTATSSFVRYDEGYYAVALPFPFNFYGVAKDSVFIGTNGTVSFQRATADAFTNAVFPTAGGSIDNNIGVWWDDQEVSQSAKVYYGTSGGSFVILFKDIRLYSATHNGAANNTFEVILSPGGLIKMQYLTMGAAAGTLVSASLGIENATGSIGLQTVFNAAYMHNNLAIVYTSDLLPWLTTDRLSGTVAPGDSQNVQLRVVGNQPAGNYFGHLRISGNTPDIANIGVRLTLTTDVATEVNIIPTVFALNQNYPNPFNPTTRITYDLPEQATVTLKIYNVLGQEVATLANGSQAPGRYEALWDGRNSFGNQVSSGVYFYRIDATRTSGQTFANMKKMLFLK